MYTDMEREQKAFESFGIQAQCGMPTFANLTLRETPK